MKIEDERLIYFFNLSKDIVIEVLENLEEYDKHNTYYPKYRDYPHTLFKRMKGEEIYEKYLSKFPPAKEGVEIFITANYNTPTNYKELLGTSDMSFGVNCAKIDKFNKLVKYLEDNRDILGMMCNIEGNPSIKYKVLSYISTIVDRYMHLNSEGGFNEELIKRLIARKMARYFDEELHFKMCIPISFLFFPKDNIKINEFFSIEKISEEMQISRYCACRFDSEYENYVLEASAYMLVSDKYICKNKSYDSYEKALENPWSYPIEEIDTFFAAIRIVKGCNTGYGQIVSEPIHWFDDACANLIELHGTTIRAFNEKLAEKDWSNHEYITIDETDLEKIINVYNLINEIKNKDPKNYKKLVIGINRLNRCMLREKEDDTVLDAMIGIETLVSGGTQGEITYTMSNRMAVIATLVEECPYSANIARKAMGNIYGYRSSIVHGREPKDSNTNIKVGDSAKMHAKDLSIEFLRYSLLFMLANQQYLNEPKDIDCLLDELITKKYNTNN